MSAAVCAAGGIAWSVVSARAWVARVDIALAAAIALGLLTMVLLLVIGRDVTFFLDDWYFIAARRGVSAASLLTPHNGHFSLLLVLAYKALLVTAGLDHVWVFRLVLVSFQATIVVLLFAVLRQRTSAPVALLLVFPIALLGAGWSDLLSPFQMSFLGSIACGLGAVLALGVPARRGAVTAALLTLFAVAWSGIGLVFLAVVAVEALARRRPRQAAAILAGPIAIYGLWYLRYHQSQRSHGLAAAVTSVWSGIPHALGSLVGSDVSAGRLLALAGAYAIVVVGVRRRRIPSGTIAGLVGVIVFFGLTGYTRGSSSFAESRYQLPACVLLVLAAGSALPRRRPPLWAMVGGGLAAALAVGGGWNDLRGGRDLLVNGDRPILAQLRAAEVGRRYAEPGFQPSPQGLGGFTQARYISMVDAFGSPATLVARLRRGDAPTRAAFDAALLGAEQIGVEPLGSISKACRPATLQRGILTVPAGTVVAVQAAPNQAATLGLRRLAPGDRFESAGTVPPGQSARLVTKRDGVQEAWVLRPFAVVRVAECP